MQLFYFLLYKMTEIMKNGPQLKIFFFILLSHEIKKISKLLLRRWIEVGLMFDIFTWK